MNLLYHLQKVSFDYGQEKLIEHLNLEIHSGDFMGIMGANGSGKTTLLRLLAGYLRVKEGSIIFNGRSLDSWSTREKARKIAVVPQTFDVLFPFTVKEVVLMGRWAHLKPLAWESKKDIEIAQQAMELTDCLEFKDRWVTELSGGEKERVLLARALAQEAEVLLLDEPTTHLDIRHQIEIFQLLKKLHREKQLTIVTVLHDLNFAALACEKILLLQKGGEARFGESKAVLNSENLQKIFGAPMEVLSKDGRFYYLPKMEL